MSEQSLTLFDLAPGKVLRDRYELVRAHRQGGMSATFEVLDRKEDATRELQVFPAALFEGHEQAMQFEERMRVWKEVESAHVLRVHEIDVLADGTCLLLTDFPAGKTLRAWLNESQVMKVGSAVKLGLGLLDGLCSVHEKDCVHGDIKPYTIHLSGKRQPDAGVLVDGGVTSSLWSAKHLGDRTALIGTPFYAPVEQFGGESPDVQSDIYNLATVLFEAVTGVVPWPGKSFLEVFQSKLERTPPSMRARNPEVEVPDAYEQAIAMGLAADRHERYLSAAEFRERLAECK